jgi:hypothetical protein
MARLIGNLNEGSLLRRTVLTVGTFVLGSVTFVALVSLLLVSIAKAVLPSRGEDADSKDAKEDDAVAVEEGTTAGKPVSAKPARTRRPRNAPAPAPDAE